MKKVGIQLLDYTVDGHLINSKESSIYSLLFWILKEPRNISHHHFKMYPLKKLMLYVLECDEALTEIDNLTRTDYNVNYKIKLEDNATKLEIYDVEVYTPENVKVRPDTKVEAHIGYIDGSKKTTPLTYQSGYWTGSHDNRGSPMGTYSVHVAGFHLGKHFTAQSGSMAMAYQPGRKCSKCGNTLSSGEIQCSNCRSYVFIE